ncbi:MAG: hypothetical protein N3D10_03340, partial [Candidatus Micrarchaeota archaeon]|nr:hypothetical protein [Candidatus Micrarchaeota archaeon]
MVKKSYFYAILFLTFLVSYFFAPLPLINLTITDISSNYSPIIITNPSSPPTVNFNVTTQSFYEEVANSVFFEEGTCSNGDEFINISPKVIGEVNWSINCTFALKDAEGSYPLIIYSNGTLGNPTNKTYGNYYIDFT